ncbi:ATP-binding protein [Nodularia sp. LEGE 06071]|nr:ATP-binding protein [Nodularia sp. LEGE 06071]MCC2691089.1 ATP-binding protein [Nodularia sp. LEGE 04288]
MFGLWQQIRGIETPKVIFDFSGCYFLRQNAVAFLGGLARLINVRGGQAIFAWNTLQSDIRINLAKNGFLCAFGNNQQGSKGNSIPYREDYEDQLEGIPDYLDEQWLGRGWVEVNQTIKDTIICTVMEIYSNAFEHGLSDIGVFSCGQRYPNLNILKLTVIDFGVGIPANVRQFFKNRNILAKDALCWAFKFGTTTRSGAIPGGTGLDSLKNFVKSKQGKIEVYSHDAYGLIDENQEIYESAPTFFEGTLINITIKCDIKHHNFTQNEVLL